MKTLIVGCERSGTSAVSSLLHLATGKSILDDPEEYWTKYPDIYANNEKFSVNQWLKLKVNNIVKIPGFATILTNLSRMHLGNFKTYYIVRDPRDNVAALLERVNQGNAELFLNTEWLNIKMDNAVEKLAMRWRRYLELAMAYQKNDGDIVFVRYEDFFDNKINTIKKISKQLNFSFDEKKIFDKIENQFRKSWDNRIRGPGRWKTDLSASEVNKIDKICGKLMRIWDYE